jgi:hypothetical protein
MPDDLIDKIEKMAEERGMTKNALINMVMSDYMGYFEDPGFFSEIRKRIEKIEKEFEQLKK